MSVAHSQETRSQSQCTGTPLILQQELLLQASCQSFVIFHLRWPCLRLLRLHRCSTTQGVPSARECCKRSGGGSRTSLSSCRAFFTDLPCLNGVNDVTGGVGCCRTG